MRFRLTKPDAEYARRPLTPRRSPPRTWLAHEAEMADNFRAISNTKSRHFAEWRMCEDEDRALTQLPQRLRQYLTSSMMDVMPPSEALANQRQHGNMLSTLVLINIAMLNQHYGSEHPNIGPLTAYAEHLRTQNL